LTKEEANPCIPYLVIKVFGVIPEEEKNIARNSPSSFVPLKRKRKKMGLG